MKLWIGHPAATLVRAKAGRVVSILVKNGDPVEFGQPLFVIE